MRVLLDTNVVSEWVKLSPDPGVVGWLGTLDDDRAYISVVTLAELSKGIALLRPSRRRDALELRLRQDLIRRFAGRVLPVDQPVAEAWGLLIAVAQRRGAMIDAMDGFLAATADVHGLTLATRNQKDFARIDVNLLNPRMRKV